MSLNRLVLVLNASYEAINIVPASRALTMLFKGSALVERPSAHSIRTARLTIILPSVIRLVHYRRVPRQNRSVSRKAIMLRDRSACQYCGHVFASKDLTLDHVIPRSRGGATAWDNLVASCKPCNNKKGDRTPVEAGMALLSKPRQIGIHAKHRLMASESDARVWDRYLFA
jgi:5-methylcytosine-specific restriction endonuclease McrA